MMKSNICLTLSRVKFDEATHTYTLDGKQLQGITGTLIRRAFPDKYKDVDPEVLAQAAAKGKALHEAIQNYDRYGILGDDERIGRYAELMEERMLTVIENEYLVSDNEHYASSIDIVADDGNGVSLIDVKSTYNLDKQSTALQLSLYKRWFEKENVNLKVNRIYALWLPNRDHTICDLVELSPWDDATLDALIEADLNDEPFEWNPIPDEYYQLEADYRMYMSLKTMYEGYIDEIKGKLMQLMQDNGMTQIKSGNYTVSYIPEKVGKRFDSASFKKENSALYNQYMKESVTAAQVRMTEVKK